jgi:hypothetical protein
MKKLHLIAYFLIIFCPFGAHALDPLAARSERSQGMIYVKTPLPESDIVTITKGGMQETLKPETTKWVPIGDYLVTVKMGDYQYNQNVTVMPTERTDVVVPGYGNLKVNSLNPNDGVEVYPRGSTTAIAKFSASQTKTLPTGYYDVKVNVGTTSVTQPNVFVVTNTTRELVVSKK